jgi:chemotaxis protein CheD
VSTAIAGLATGPTVGIGQIAASDQRDLVISALGLGSCIGVVLVDARAQIAGMAHVMLPQSAATSKGPPGKFADTAIPALLDSVLSLGADRARLVATIAGGAQMFGAGSGAGLFNIGGRNDESVRAALTDSRIRLRAHDVGGSFGRTMQVRVGTGTVTVRLVGGEPVEL